MKARQVSDTRLTLAGGIPGRVESRLLPGPALSVTFTVLDGTPFYLAHNTATRVRQMELRMISGVYYWAENFGDYLRTDTARGSLQLQPLTRMEDDARPTYIVFTDDGSPSAAIIAGYIAIAAACHAYEAGGMRLRPTNNQAPENALLVLARSRETQFGRR